MRKARSKLPALSLFWLGIGAGLVVVALAYALL